MMEQFVSMGVPAHFFHLMEASIRRLPNVKTSLRWPSRFHIYCSVGLSNEEVRAHFSLCLYLCTMHLLLTRHLAMKHEIPASSESRFIHAVNKASSERKFALVGRAK